MKGFSYFNASINDSSVTVWVSSRIKLLLPDSLKQVIFIPPSVSPPPLHSLVSQALCQCAQLLPYWQKNQSHLTPKLPVHIVLLYLGLEQTICSDSYVNFLISPRSLLLFLVNLSRGHKRQPLNPTSFRYNAKLTVWQAIMLYYTLSIQTYLKHQWINELNNKPLNKNIHSTMHHKEKQKKHRRKKNVRIKQLILHEKKRRFK